MQQPKFVPRRGAGADDSSIALSRALNSWLEEFGPTGIFRTCANCRNMVKEGNAPAFCNLFQMTPPVGIIVAGCDKHDDDNEVPF